MEQVGGLVVVREKVGRRWRVKTWPLASPVAGHVGAVLAEIAREWEVIVEGDDWLPAPLWRDPALDGPLGPYAPPGLWEARGRIVVHFDAPF